MNIPVEVMIRAGSFPLRGARERAGVYLVSREAEAMAAEEVQESALGPLDEIGQGRTFIPLAEEVMGWDVLGYTGTCFLAWWEDDLEGPVRDGLGIEVTPSGLLVDLATARAVAAWLNEQDLGSPVIWRAVLLARPAPC